MKIGDRISCPQEQRHWRWAGVDAPPPHSPKTLRGISDCADPFHYIQQTGCGLVSGAGALHPSRAGPWFVWPQLASEWETLTEPERLEGAKPLPPPERAWARRLYSVFRLGCNDRRPYAKHAGRARRHHFAAACKPVRSGRDPGILSAGGQRPPTFHCSARRWVV